MKRGRICQRMARGPITEAPRRRFYVPIFPYLKVEEQMGWRGEVQAKRRKHADCGERYAWFMRRKRVVTTVGGGLRYLGKYSVGDHLHKSPAFVALKHDMSVC